MGGQKKSSKVLKGVSLAGIGDLEAFARFVPVLCGPGIIERLAPATDSADRYAEISPAALPPPG
jgi:hypothetical protein